MDWHGQLLEVRLPVTVQLAVQNEQTLPVLMQQVCSYLFSHIPGESRFIPTLFRLWVRDRLSERVQYFVWRLFVPNVRDRRLIVLPKPLTFFYYLLRPLRLLGEKLGFIDRRSLGSDDSEQKQSVAIQSDVDWVG